MLKKATLTLAVALAFSQNGFAAAQTDYTVKRESVSSTNLTEVKQALSYKRDIVIKDTAYIFDSMTSDGFGQTYRYQASDSSDKLVVRKRGNSISALLFENGVQKTLSLTDNGGILSRYHSILPGKEPGVPSIQQPTASPSWHKLRPTNVDTKRTVSETVSTLPETAGAAFFISADTYVAAEAAAADTSDNVSPESIIEQDLAVFNTALSEAGVNDVSVDVRNYYLIADDEGGFFASDDVMAKAEFGAGEADFISTMHINDFEDNFDSRANTRIVTNNNPANAEQSLRFVKESHVKYLPFSNDKLAHAFGHNLGLNHERSSLDQVVPGAIPYAFLEPSETATIMASSDDADAERVAFFSNPDEVVNGITIGVEDSMDDAADNAQFLRKTAKLSMNGTNLKSSSSLTVNDSEVTLNWTPMPETVKQTLIGSNYNCNLYRTDLNIYTSGSGSTRVDLGATQTSVAIDASTSSCLVVVNWVELEGNTLPIIRVMQEYRGDAGFFVDNVNVSTEPGSTTTVPVYTADADISNNDIDLYFSKLSGSTFADLRYEDADAVQQFLTVTASGSGNNRELTFEVSDDYMDSLDWIESLASTEIQPQLLRMFVNLAGTNETYSLNLDMRGMYEAIPRATSSTLVGKVNDNGAEAKVTITDTIDSADVSVSVVSDGFSDWTPDFDVSQDSGETTVTVSAPSDLFAATDETFAIVKVAFGDSRLYKQVGFIESKTSDDDSGDGGSDGGSGGDSGGGSGGDSSGGSGGGSGGDSGDGSSGGDSGGGGGGSLGIAGLFSLALLSIRRRLKLR